MSTQDKLVEALRVAREWLNSDKWRNSTIDKHKSWEAIMRGIDAALAEYDALAAYDAEAAQTQVHSGEWVVVPREPTQAMLDANGDCEGFPEGKAFLEEDARVTWANMLAAAPQPQAAESIKRVIERMNAMRWAGFSDVPLKVVADWATDLSVAIGETPFDGLAHDAHPQPSQVSSVPGELVGPVVGTINYEQELSFVEGWNAGREAALAAQENPNG